MVGSGPYGIKGVIGVLREPPRPVVVSPSRLTPSGLGLALGLPLALALLIAHLGDLHHLHMDWFLGGMALVMLTSIASSTSLTFEAGVVHLRTRMLGVRVRDRPLMSEAVLERILVRAIPSLRLGPGSNAYQLLLVGGGEQQVVGPFDSRQRASEVRLAIRSSLAASRREA